MSGGVFHHSGDNGFRSDTEGSFGKDKVDVGGWSVRNSVVGITGVVALDGIAVAGVTAVIGNEEIEIIEIFALFVSDV